ncbi:uncharacterized protein BT62DRAFT_881020, partial [Guyanagaster necrorhizus]
LPGHNVQFSDWKDLKDDTRSALVAQLRDYVLQLRNIPPPVESSMCDSAPIALTVVMSTRNK